MMDKQAIRSHSALHIQSIYRGHVVRQNIIITNIAATQIQRIVRLFLAQLSFGFDLMDIISAQSIGRRYIAQLALQRKHEKSITIQRMWRGYRAKLSYGFCLMKITTVQSVARMHMAKNQVTRVRSAVQITRAWRGYQALCFHRNALTCITKIQSIARCFLHYKYFMRQRKAAIAIQSLYRQRSAVKSLTRTVISAIKIQCLFRTNRDIQYVNTMQTSAVRIQSLTRQVMASNLFKRVQIDAAMFQAKLTSVRNRNAARTIQQFIRRQSIISSFHHATTIQRFWRGYSHRSNFKSVLKHVKLLQSLGRRYIAKMALVKSKIKCDARFGVNSVCHHPSNKADPPMDTQSGLKQALKEDSLSLAPGDDAYISRVYCQKIGGTESDHKVAKIEVAQNEGSFDSAHSNFNLETEPMGFEDCESIEYNCSKDYDEAERTPPHLEPLSVGSTDQDKAQAVGVSHRARGRVLFRGKGNGEAPKKNESEHPVDQARDDISENSKENKSRTKKVQHRPSSQASFVKHEGFASTQGNSSTTPQQFLVRDPKSLETTPLCINSNTILQRGILQNKSRAQPSNASSASLTAASLVRKSVVTINSHNNANDETSERQKLRKYPPENIEIQSIGVQTRSKANIFRSLDAAKSKERVKISSDQLLSPIENSTGSYRESRGTTPSSDLERTIIALEVIEKSRRLSELKDSIITLEHTTRNSNECCKYFARAKGQIMLCILISSCNRSSPHLELMHTILQILTNVAVHRSTTQRLASNEIVEVIIYVCQMFRDKSKLLALSSSLLDRILMNANCDLLVSQLWFNSESTYPSSLFLTVQTTFFRKHTHQMSRRRGFTESCRYVKKEHHWKVQTSILEKAS